MNYYAQGGQAHGLKVLAQELPKYGRYNDDMVAHISSDEAKVLKAMGGSGTINPVTGLPEFGLGSVFKSITAPVQQAVAAVNPFNPGSLINKTINQIPVVGQANQALNNLGTQIFQPLEKAIVQPTSAGLANLDKAVGKAIPGGWGTLASVAGSAMGLPTPLLVGMGALSGSGVTHKGGKFNLQGAMLGGAMAYASSELGDYMRGAADGAAQGASQGAVEATKAAAEGTATDGITSLYNSTGGFAEPVTSSIPQSAINTANAATSAAQTINPATGIQYGSVLGDTLAGNAPVQPSIMSNIMGGNFGDAASQIGTNISEGMSNLGTKVGSAYDTVTNPETYSDLTSKAGAKLSEYGTNVQDTGSGIKNLMGLGDMTAKEAAAQAAKVAATEGTMKPLLAAGVVGYTGMGLAALDEQRKYLDESKAANAISQAEYDEAVARIEEQRQDAERTVSENPWSVNPDRDTSIGETYYERTKPKETLYENNPYEYAQGGTVTTPNMVNPPDDQTGMPSQSPLSSDFGMSNLMDGQAYGNQNQQNVQNPYPSAYNYTGDNSASSAYNSTNLYPASPYTSGTSGSYGLGSIADQGNQNALPLEGQYGIIKMAQGGMFPMYADGGMPPRFLSGGGDGMSDSIKANIGGEQEARLADGEFVIPADVVSHLGNGSSKAGAKQLYSMMDKVRTARTGRKSQGKQINPSKYMPV